MLLMLPAAFDAFRYAMLPCLYDDAADVIYAATIQCHMLARRFSRR